MSKFGWSYPAGCSGPPDTEGPDDALADAVWGMLEQHTQWDEGLNEMVFEFCKKLRSDAYAEGYRDGKSDEGMARDYTDYSEEKAKLDFVNNRGE